MTARVHECVRTFPNGDGVAAAAYLRVRNNSGNLALANSEHEELGVLERPMLAGDETAPVRFLAPDVSVRMVAGEAIAQYADVYRFDGGKVGDTVSGDRLGIALEAASGDGSIIEVLPVKEAPTLA